MRTTKPRREEDLINGIPRDLAQALWFSMKIARWMSKHPMQYGPQAPAAHDVDRAGPQLKADKRRPLYRLQPKHY